MKRSAFVRASLLLVLAVTTAGAQTPLRVEGLAVDAPLRVTAAATASRLVVDVDMDSEWHLYARDVGGGQPVTITLAKGGGFAAAGPLVIPGTPDGKLRGAFRLELPIRRMAQGEKIKAAFAFMACDPMACMPPMTVTIEGTVRRMKPIMVLLAVDVEDERSKRLTAFLDGNGFRTTVRTFDAVKVAECDAHDVVLVDSKLFRKYQKGSIQKVRAFPRTRAPIVAVGFLGTELIEGHGLAMTSGYI